MGRYEILIKTRRRTEDAHSGWRREGGGRQEEKRL